MTAARTERLAGLTAARRAALRAECTRLAALDDAEFGARLLANTPTHEDRDPGLLRRWAEVATAFGAELAGGETAPGPDAAGTRARVVECEDGVERLLLARYVSRPVPTVELYTDTLALGEELTAFLGWHAWFPPGSLRAAALAHEESHHRLHHDGGLRRALRHRLGHTAVRVGPLRFAGHVAGAGEVAAHGHARAWCGLGRTPLLLTSALASAVQALTEN